MDKRKHINELLYILLEDNKAVNVWLTSYNLHLNAVPNDLISEDRHEEVIDYLERFIGRGIS